MPQPNILLITSDQHRADSLGCAGHPVVRTPHLDALAYQGMRFEHAYSNCPVCIPARTSLITGLQAHRYGMPAYCEEYRIERPREKFLGSLLTQAGYQTELVGKTHWHTSAQCRGGFEHVTWMSSLRKERLIKSGRATTLDGMGFNEMSTTLSELPPELQMTNWVVDRALDFLDTREREQPFFLWTSFQDPHPPLVIHEPYYSMYQDATIPVPVLPEWCDSDACPAGLYNHRWMWNPGPLSPEEIHAARAVYYGMVTNLDHQIGRLFGQLIADGDWDNTLVIYLSDHGDQLGDHGDVAKSTFLEHSVRIPMILRPPADTGVSPGVTSGALMDIADVLPTICEYAGVPAPEDIDGKSVAPVMRGETSVHHEAIHGQIEDMHMWRTERYKYLYFAEDGSELVFDAVNDPRDEHPLDEMVAEPLREAFIKHLQDENHPHVDAGGKLLNRGLSRLSRSELASRHIQVQALAPTAMLGNIQRSITHLH